MKSRSDSTSQAWMNVYMSMTSLCCGMYTFAETELKLYVDVCKTFTCPRLTKVNEWKMQVTMI